MNRFQPDPTPSWKKHARNVVIVVVVIVGLFLAVDGLTYLQAKHRVSSSDTPELQAAAKAFAKRGDSTTCEDEAIARIMRCSDDARGSDKRFFGTLQERRESRDQCILETMLFHGHCLDAARKSPGFCDRPKNMGISEHEWFRRRCDNGGLMPSPFCITVLTASVEHCRP